MYLYNIASLYWKLYSPPMPDSSDISRRLCSSPAERKVGGRVGTQNLVMLRGQPNRKDMNFILGGESTEPRKVSELGYERRLWRSN